MMATTEHLAFRGLPFPVDRDMMSNGYRLPSGRLISHPSEITPYIIEEERRAWGERQLTQATRKGAPRKPEVKAVAQIIDDSVLGTLKKESDKYVRGVL